MFTNRELATVLASLRLFQVTGSQDIDSLGVDLREHFADHHPLTDPEIDALCERLNSAPDPAVPDRLAQAADRIATADCAIRQLKSKAADQG